MWQSPQLDSKVNEDTDSIPYTFPYSSPSMEAVPALCQEVFWFPWQCGCVPQTKTLLLQHAILVLETNSSHNEMEGSNKCY